MTTTSTILRTSALAMIASGFLALSVPALAADADHVPQGAINATGTDYTSTRSVDHLVKRLHRVALDICAPDRAGPATMTDGERGCYETAIRSGMTQIDSKRQQAMRATSVHVATAQPAATAAH
jgi:UrcA family protein